MNFNHNHLYKPILQPTFVSEKITTKVNFNFFFDKMNTDNNSETGIYSLGKLNDVIYLEQIAQNIIIHTKQQHQIIEMNTIKMFESELAPKGFVMANYKSLINTENIESFYLGNNRSILMSNGTQIKISRRKLHQFKELVKEKGIR